MAELRLIPVDKLVEPRNPQRTTTLMQGIEELCESLEQNGQQQNIGVIEHPNGDFEVIWGHRRSIAFTMLGWKDCTAKVFRPDEGDIAMLMAHENFHRENINPIEEGRFYARVRDEAKVSLAEVARRCRRSQSHVSRLVSLLEGDDRVAQAVEEGLINPAQAVEINKWTDELGRMAALRHAQLGGMTANHLKIWREQREIHGIDVTMEQVSQQLAEMPKIDYRENVVCQIHKDWVPIQNAPLRPICEECWLKVWEILEIFRSQAEKRAEEGESGASSESVSRESPASSLKGWEALIDGD